MIVAVVLHWGRLGFEWLRESDGSEQRQVLKRVFASYQSGPCFHCWCLSKGVGMNAGGSVWATAVDIVVGRRWWTKNLGEGKALR
jgi:hypothetical protein